MAALPDLLVFRPVPLVPQNEPSLMGGVGDRLELGVRHPARAEVDRLADVVLTSCVMTPVLPRRNHQMVLIGKV
jgi:hypothetical protein